MKKKTYIKLMTATVLASTLLLGLVEIKRKQLKQAVLLRQANHQVLKQLLLSKESKTQKSSSSASSEKAKASTDQSSATATPSQATPEQRQGKKWLINR